MANSLPLGTTVPTRIIDSRHPSFMSSMIEWDKWRITYRGGDEFKQKYLEQFTTREDRVDFITRSALTPVPSFAKSAINDIRNSIFQRMRDISRTGGSEAYRRAIAGNDLGVDRRGASMNAFLGMKVLTDLLVMGRVGVFVDNSRVEGASLADTRGVRPYLYSYQVEDILSWSCTSPDNPSTFQSILLRDTCLDYDQRTLLPLSTFQRFRLMWLEGGQVMLQFYDMDGNAIDRDGNKSETPTKLNLSRIPFVMLDIGDSLIKDVCDYQVALLNLASSDVWYALKANFPFYIEQRDLRAGGGHLKNFANPDGTASTGGQPADDRDIEVGATHGRAYDVKVNPPAFINPSSEPLEASIKLQEKWEHDIRKLVNLSVQSIATRSSAESKSMDNQGLEAGLSCIGLVLESAERQIAEFWAAYESSTPSQREVAAVKYPDRYSLKTDMDRIQESSKLKEVMTSLPGRVVKKEIAKQIVNTLLGGRVNVDTIDKIINEIDDANYLTSDPDTIIQAVEAGLVSDKTGSIALGFDDDEYLKAHADHAERVARIALAQSHNAPGPTQPAGGRQAVRSLTNPDDTAKKILDANPDARGLLDLAPNPQGAKAEKKAASDPTLNPNRGRRQRGKSAKAPVTGANPKG